MASSFRLNAHVAHLAPMLGRLIGEHIEVHIVPGASLGQVKADPTQLDQVLMNLVVNARDAMPGGGRLTVATGHVDLDERFAREHPGAPAGPHVTLTVADSGCGMDAETMAQVFEPFFTTKGPGAGTGLGLSTVYGIVKQHGGYISVDSAPGAGATFTVYLSRVPDAVAAPPGPEAPTPPPGGDETVLLVEDDEGVRGLARELLEVAGHTVLAPATPTEALELAARRDGAIALLLTDTVMPGMSGRDVAERACTLHPGIGVLFMAGYPRDVLGPGTTLDPRITFVATPFTAEVLPRGVRDTIDGRYS